MQHPRYRSGSPTSFDAASPDDAAAELFLACLQRFFPESGHAPLIIYRLFPLAISVATAIAFGQLARAEETRKGQIAWLPGIADCPACHGRLLENGEKCQQCGNPFWKTEWLTAE